MGKHEKPPSVRWTHRLLAKLSEGLGLNDARIAAGVSWRTINRELEKGGSFCGELKRAMAGDYSGEWQPPSVVKILKAVTDIGFAFADSPQEATALQLNALNRVGELCHPQLFRAASNEHHHYHAMAGVVDGVVSPDESAAETIRKELLQHDEYLDALRGGQTSGHHSGNGHAGPVCTNGKPRALGNGKTPGHAGPGTNGHSGGKE